MTASPNSHLKLLKELLVLRILRREHSHPLFFGCHVHRRRLQDFLAALVPRRLGDGSYHGERRRRRTRSFDDAFEGGRRNVWSSQEQHLGDRGGGGAEGAGGGGEEREEDHCMQDHEKSASVLVGI